MIKLQTLKLEKINYDNKVHLNYIKLLMKSQGINYLWDLADPSLQNNKNVGKYIVINNNDEYIGYVNISDKTEAVYGNTVSLYYAVDQQHRGKEYGKMIVDETKEWLFNEMHIDCVVAQVNTENHHSINTLNKAGMDEVMKDDEYVTFIERKNR